MRIRVALVVSSVFDFEGSRLAVEILPEASGLIARACLHPYTDAFHTTETCEPAREAVPASTVDDERDCMASGTLILTADPFTTAPEDVHGRFEGRQGDAFSIVATF
jgi:hypothetical protein